MVGASEHDEAPKPQAARWWGIVFVILVPWVVVYGIRGLGSSPPTEVAMKDQLFRQRSLVDTVVVGDSRVLRLDENVFQSHGWAFFNMGLSGLSPEDMALALRYALVRGQVKRVVMGVSFEGLTERSVYDQSRTSHEPAFLATATDLFGLPLPPPAESGIRALARQHFLPVGDTTPRLHMLLVGLHLETLPPYFLPNGNVAYVQIQREIALGDYDFAHNRDPQIYFRRTDSEVAYLAAKELSPSGRQTYRQVIRSLRDAKIPLVMFETGRTNAYQALIDADPLLKRLQTEWRQFYRAETGPCVRFVEAATIPFAQEDFIDAVHFIGPSERTVATKLADELADTEVTCSSAPARPNL